MFLMAILCFGSGSLLEINIEYEPNLELSFKDIFVNNLSVNFYTILSSVISLGLYSIFFVGKEFLMLGIIIRGLAKKETLMYALSFIGFHGILEIPAMVLAAAIGQYIVWALFGVIKRKYLIKNIIKEIFFMCITLFVLTAIGAFIEANITVWFLQKVVLG